MVQLRSLLLKLFSHRLLAISRWDLHFLKVRLLNRITLGAASARRRVRRMPQPRFLNLGAGPRGLADPHWLNVDGYPDQNVHLVLDLARPLPLQDGCLDGLFTEHVLEHFTLADGEDLMREAHRVLRPGGCIRIIVPDGEFIIRQYFDAPEALVAWRDGSAETPMIAVNDYFRQRYEHQFLYDWATLQWLLRRAGFSDVRRASYGQGELSGPIIVDDPKYEWESLYVEARR